MANAQRATNPEESQFPLRAAAIDVGSNALRFLAVEFSEPGSFHSLGSERCPVRLGHDVFLSGKLTEEAMTAAVEGVKGFAGRMKELDIQRYRAVATSAVRESRNGTEFVHRVNEETGIMLEAITGSEEARLVHQAVMSRIPLDNDQWMLADLGGGSVEVSLADKSGILWSESHNMGSVRLLEALAGAAEDPSRFGRLLSEYIDTLRLPTSGRFHRLAGFIATGGNIETLARLALGNVDESRVSILPVDLLRSTIDTLTRLSYRDRVSTLNLREDRADVILPAAMVYKRLAVLAGVKQIHVPFVGVRDGVVIDLADRLVTRRHHEDIQEKQTRESAVNMGRRYMFDEAHATQVARLALSLFDQLSDMHGLQDEDRRILLAAALLHDIGCFINIRKHHKHTHYIISQSELPGFTPEAMLVAANVARYHRKSDPSPRHEGFAALNARDRERTLKLSAILRLADALDREHLQKVHQVSVSRNGNTLELSVNATGDMLLERWALQSKAQLFGKVFGFEVKFNI